MPARAGEEGNALANGMLAFTEAQSSRDINEYLLKQGSIENLRRTAAGHQMVQNGTEPY